jgi:predicted secreted hydrolase
VRRRDLLAFGFCFPALAFSEIRYPKVISNHALQFPRDHGAHPDYRQEWWYVTGWLKTARGEDLGFQITFFRTRLNIENPNPSSFTPRQVILAHAALADPKHGRLRHDERAARTALDLAGSREGNTSVWVDDWVLALEKDIYQARIRARDFSLELQFEAKGKPLLQGQAGFSRKGSGPEEASYYYSRPHLAVRGTADAGRLRGPRGWITSGRASTWPRARRVGTGAASTWTTATL